jgi:YD repeat-containing protein
VGQNYTTPPGDFSTLTRTASGYTRTLPNGTQITFDTSGNQVATIDRNSLHTTYSYSSGLLSTILDSYAKLTTFTYSSGKLSSIKDPAGRLTTFTFTGNNLTAVQQADGARVTLTYDASPHLTQRKDPLGHVTSIVYDSAQRVGTITRPDSTSQAFSSYQEQGWTNSGTSGSPAAATLLAEAASNSTDPNGNTSQMRPDWLGLGTTGQATDALGNVTTYDRDSNGLATVVIAIRVRPSAIRVRPSS